MIRFCNAEEIDRKEYEAALRETPLLWDENIWRSIRDRLKYMTQEEGTDFFIPLVNKTGDILGFAYQDREADRELRFLEEIRETEGTLQFTDLFSDITSVTILECNELAYQFAQYLKHIGVTVYAAGKYWEYLGYRERYVGASPHNLVIYAEGSTQDWPEKWAVNKMRRSVSAEFECIDQIYEENFRRGIIRDRDWQFEELIEYLKEGEKRIVILGTGDSSQDACDLLLEHGVDICAFMQDGLSCPRTLFGKPILSRSEVFRRIEAPMLIRCKESGSALGSGVVDTYHYYGYKRNKAFFLLRDYTDIRESRLIHILEGKKIVLTGDRRLCGLLEDFYKRKLKDAIAVRYSDHILDERLEDEIVLSAFHMPYGGEMVRESFQERQKTVRDAIAHRGIDHTKYFETIDHFVGLEQPERKYRLEKIRPKGILLGNIQYFSGNIFFRDILDGHTQILKMDYSFLNNNLFSYCIRLSGEKAENILESFREIYSEEANAEKKECIFPEKEKFERKLQSLLALSEKFSAQELFVIFMAAYEAMFDRETENMADKVIYWEPHCIDRDSFVFYAKWLEDAEIAGKTMRMFRNGIVRAGSYLNFTMDQDCKYAYLFLVDLPSYKSYESAVWKEFTVRFEDLKLAPAKTLGFICEQTGIRWENGLLQTTSRGGSSSYLSTTGFDLRPVYDYFEEYLSSFDRFRISVITAGSQKKYGYPYFWGAGFSRKLLQEMFLKDFRFEEQIGFRDHEEKTRYNYTVYRILCDLLWETRKEFLMTGMCGENKDCAYEDVCKVHKYWTSKRENALREAMSGKETGEGKCLDTFLQQRRCQ